MATTKRRASAKKPAHPAPPESTDTMIRGLTPADLEALERAVARRSTLLGGAFVSRNTTLLSLLRAALQREDFTGTLDTGETT